MKYLVSAALLILVINSGCKKSMEQHSVEGTWELRSVYGGLAAPGSGSFAPGNGNGYKFTATTYETYSDHNQVASGTYSKSRGMSPQTNREMDVITLDGSMRIYYERSKNTLTFYIGVVAADGVIAKYVKQ